MPFRASRLSLRGGRLLLGRPRARTELPLPPGRPLLVSAPTFTAIDFETADRWSDSACAVALVRVEQGQVVHREVRLIRPPRPEVHFTEVHGITWEDVEDKPTFGELWPGLAPMVDGAHFIAAHNAPFDRGVLAACLEAASLSIPETPFLCTVKLSRGLWSQQHNRLPDVCARLNIPLKHHNPLSDAEACAHIVLAALRETTEQEARPARGSPQQLPGVFALMSSAAEFLREKREAQQQKAVALIAKSVVVPAKLPAHESAP